MRPLIEIVHPMRYSWAMLSAGKGLAIDDYF